MRRYIDADSLLTKIKAYRPYQYLGEDALSYAIKMVELEPSADVRENVRANLVIAGYKRDGSTQWFECSVCGGAVDFTDNFCKHCGAYFKGERHDMR